MRRRLTLMMFAIAALVLAVPSAAPAARPKKAPKISFVSPMRAQVGTTMTIRGSGFSAARSRNTVVFRGPNGRTAFAKPRRASRRKLVIRVPGPVARLMSRRADGRQVPTRFKLRVLSGRFGKYTARRLSPVILPVGFSSELGGGSGGGVIPPPGVCGTGSDYDGDLLSNTFEVSIKTDVCLKDTDLDGAEDGYEYQAAVDLNNYPATGPLPYPGKRPYPNALDPSDFETDYDGDGMTLRDEFQMWVSFSADGVGSGHPATLSNLLYSDGLKRSRLVGAPADALTNWALDANEDGSLHDGERDVDGDGLGNWDEAHGKMTEDWWPAIHGGGAQPKESKYPEINFLDNDDLPTGNAHADPDLDGDGVNDGNDDYDHDGLSNQFEVRRPADWLMDAWGGVASKSAPPGANSWAYTNPFNPCKPFDSERCHEYPPVGYYDADEVPPIGPTPPGGYPGSRPTTPDG